MIKCTLTHNKIYNIWLRDCKHLEIQIWKKITFIYPLWKHPNWSVPALYSVWCVLLVLSASVKASISAAVIRTAAAEQRADVEQVGTVRVTTAIHPSTSTKTACWLAEEEAGTDQASQDKFSLKTAYWATTYTKCCQKIIV